jgi:hypothetical protein
MNASYLSGQSVVLANLSRELAEKEAAGMKSKLLSFMPCTSCRQQANNLTGNRQQDRDTEMSNADSEILVLADGDRDHEGDGRRYKE